MNLGTPSDQSQFGQLCSTCRSYARRIPFLLLVTWLVSLTAACSDATSPTTPTPTGPTTDTFASAFTVKGSASRTFTASQAGTVLVTLDSVGPPANVVVGFGLGVPLVNGVSCLLTSALTTAAGPGVQIVMQADAGSYCVKVYDVGNLVETVRFSISITRP